MANEIDVEYLGSLLIQIDPDTEVSKRTFTRHLDEFSVSIYLETRQYSGLKAKDCINSRKQSAEFDYEEFVNCENSFVQCARFDVTLRGPEKPSYGSQAIFGLFTVMSGDTPEIEVVDTGDGEVFLMTSVFQQLTGDRTRDRRNLIKGFARIERKFKRFHLLQENLRDQ